MDSHGNLIAISLLFFHPAYFPSAKFEDKANSILGNF